jgi:hypothetical protein
LVIAVECKKIGAIYERATSSNHFTAIIDRARRGRRIIP